MNRSYQRKITLSTQEKVKRLKELIKDAEEMKFEPKLIKKYKKQLQEHEGILQKIREKTKTRLKEYKDMQKLKEDLEKNIIKEKEIVVLNEGKQKEGMSSAAIRYHRALI